MTTQVDKTERAHRDYTAGWICALPKEQTAATAMLDRRHNRLSKPPNDPNTYTLGSVGEHNVVIACLPKGQIGNNSAATVAASMIQTFPSIRFGMLVGIGGGIPPHVRLGDVVVSTPIGQFPGVIQWDMGKAKEGGNFERTGSLNNPPTSLLTALAALETDHELEGSKISDHLENMRDRWPRLVPKYLPSGLQDVLFRADYGHKSGRAVDPGASSHVGENNNNNAAEEEEEEERSCQFCDKEKVVKRRTRDMTVHFGLIASGNKVIKDAVFRDQLNKDLGGQVLCIEMEAAGLMNNFPCIVIRGICDYADSHKNKAWQEYAAVRAAAFAKEFLEFLQPSEAEVDRPVKEMLGKVLDTITQTGSDIQKMSSHLESKEDLEILDWIKSIEYGLQQSDFLARRQRRTGNWLLESTKFLAWKDTKNQTMFCPGMPGAGKTIICSVVIDHLSRAYQEDQKIGMSYIYLNYQRHNDQEIDNLLATLVKQLARQCLPLPKSVKELYNSHKIPNTRPSVEEMSEVLRIVAGNFSRVFLIIDALDECETSCRLRFMLELSKLQEHHGVNIFVTSRFIPEIENQFQGCPSLEIRAADEDVRTYLDRRMSQLRPFVQEDQQLQEEIKSSILSAVDGMFLLAQIYLGFLDDKLTTNEIRDSLKTFQRQDPGSSELQKTEVLSHAYDRVMDRIQQQQGGLKQMAFKVLSWIICAKRPLSVPELQHALAIKEGNFWLDEGDLPHIGDIVSVCLGLITIDKGSNNVRLVHYTTQEYFTRSWKDWISNARIEIARSCITYMSFEIFESGACLESRDIFDRLESYSLYEYSVTNWGYHARNSQVESEKRTMDFLQNESKLSAYNQVLAWVNSVNDLDLNMTALHLAAYFGLNILVSKLLERNFIVDADDGYGHTPLFLAAQEEHETVTRLLLENRANVDPCDDDYQTPLIVAAGEGHEKIVKLLLESNARVDHNDTFDRTPLFAAAKEGHEAVVKLLLEHKATVNYRDEFGTTPLSAAAENGHEVVVKLLLQQNAIIDLKDQSGRTELFWAASKGHRKMVELLLENNASVNSIDEYGGTPLSIATRRGYEPVVKLLLKNGATVDHQGYNNWTPLLHASENGHYAVAKLLIDNGATIDSTEVHGETPLSMATKYGHEEVVKLLLEKQAEQKSLENEKSADIDLR